MRTDQVFADVMKRLKTVDKKLGKACEKTDELEEIGKKANDEFCKLGKRFDKIEEKIEMILSRIKTE